MSNSTSGNKKTARQILEERKVKFMAEIARLQAAAQQEEEEECKRQEEEAEKKRLAEEQKRREVEETRKRIERARQEKARTQAASLSAGSGGPEVACELCVTRGRTCTWEVAIKTPRIRTCDPCRQAKEKCVGGNMPVKAPAGKGKGKKRARPDGTPSPKGKGKRCQQSPELGGSDVEVISDSRMIVEEQDQWAEYDDQAWVAAANNIVAELVRTNGLLERGIRAADGSRAAMDRVSDNMQRFMEQQREFQALFLEGVRNGLRIASSETPEEESGAETEKDTGNSSRDMETDPQ